MQTGTREAMEGAQSQAVLQGVAWFVDKHKQRESHKLDSHDAQSQVWHRRTAAPPHYGPTLGLYLDSVVIPETGTEHTRNRHKCWLQI